MRNPEQTQPETEDLPERLVTAVADDFPTAREVLVDFRDEWELVRTFRNQDQPLYAAAFSWEEERPRRDHFYGLSPEINLTLKRYRQYKLFQPWPQPTIRVAWDVEAGEGRVLPGGHLNVRLQAIAEAQVWSGDHYGVLWECFGVGSQSGEQWQDELTRFWRTVEVDMGVDKIYTLPADPAFAEGYIEFFRGLGYQPDGVHPAWWSREVAR